MTSDNATKNGRKKRGKNKTTIARELALQETGTTPLEFMLSGLAWYWKLVRRLVADGADERAIAGAYLAGKQFASEALPFCHPRLASVELKVPPPDLSKLTDGQLADLKRALQPLAVPAAAMGGGAEGGTPPPVAAAEGADGTRH